MNEKIALKSEIIQTRTMSKGSKHVKKCKNPFFRYVVSLPANYQPRSFDINYVLKEWDRIGHPQTFWARVENAEILAERKNGAVLWETKEGDYVKIKHIVANQTVTRKKGTPTVEKEASIYRG